MRHSLQLTIALGLALAGAPASPAMAGDPNLLDITGTWAGTFSCKGMNNAGEKYKEAGVLTARIRIDGSSDVAVEIDPSVGTAGEPGGDGGEGFCGFAVQQAGKPGKGSLAIGVSDSTGTNVVADADLPVAGVSFKSVKLFTADSAGISGKMVGSGSVLPLHADRTGTCKVKLQRTSESLPAISSELLADCDIEVVE